MGLRRKRRVQTSSPSILESEDSLQFLWAVSYSDLLMVLLSFFIVYFSFSGQEKNSLIQRISVSIGAKGHSIGFGSKSGSAKEVGSYLDSNLDSAVFKGVVENLAKNFRVIRNPDGVHALDVDLSDELFEPGQFEIPGAGRTSIEELIRSVSPFKGKISLVFIGHSDQRPVLRHRSRLLDSNLILSSLRATRAVEYAIAQGWDSHFISTEGRAEFARGTRSLTVRILERNSDGH